MSTINFLLLVELIVVVIVVTAFLFYWGRVLGSVVAFIIRVSTWRSHSAYISIGSLQISPLAGRISFRDVEYQSSNISFRALHGRITWRYWLLRIRHEEDAESSNPNRSASFELVAFTALTQDKLPCRIEVWAEGVEAFVFNRTPAYDAIVERMKKHEQQTGVGSSSESLSNHKSNDDSNTKEGSSFGARLRRVAQSRKSQDDDRSSSQSGCNLMCHRSKLILQPLPTLQTRKELQRNPNPSLRLPLSIGSERPVP